MSFSTIIRLIFLLALSCSAAHGDGDIIRLQPRIRTLPGSPDSYGIPLAAIRPFLATMRALEPAELDKTARIVNFADEHLVAGAGDVLYAEPVKDNGSAGYQLFRPGEACLDAHSGELLGYEALYIGTASMESAGDPSVFRLTETVREAHIGDRLLRSEAEPLLSHIIPARPDFAIAGSIIGVVDGVTLMGQYQAVVIDRGLRNGLKAGHILRIVQDTRAHREIFEKNPGQDHTRYPQETKGRLIIIHPYEKLSFALIMNTRKAVHVFDTVAAP
ncbi:hypothetical protein F6R98_18285 [Candidatus Methylospira mobilis]|uniref:Peptidoglycan-binding protein n=1 Tax=Candidatus Methylospira mobilis TaxID=1808979 RepID=A0A5Q0BMG8_9GAMM|nr:hypothetical protein [Candidatus Methylospira mobilis]QFY44342.1 hypothetical protein F6R98_18285 [Candidatus Methylospira mobilis]WNV06227.1 hypothetical protein RP726_07415 [Candidatus Methylospira mobilis]